VKPPRVGPLHQRGDHTLVGQGPSDAFGRTGAVGGEDDAVAAVEETPDTPGEGRRVAVDPLDRRAGDVGSVGPVGSGDPGMATGNSTDGSGRRTSPGR